MRRIIFLSFIPLTESLIIPNGVSGVINASQQKHKRI